MEEGSGAIPGWKGGKASCRRGIFRVETLRIVLEAVAGLAGLLLMISMFYQIAVGLFGFGKKDKEQESTENKADDANEDGEEKNVVRKDKHKEDTTDKDGYMAFKLPWSLSFSYGVSLAEDHTKSKFNVRTHRYPYKLTHTLNFSGNVGISSNWSFSFSSGYDFNNHRISATTCSIGRSMHCFDMSGSFVVGPYTSYNISLRANASELADALKYEKKSSMSSTLDWY